MGRSSAKRLGIKFVQNRGRLSEGSEIECPRVGRLRQSEMSDFRAVIANAAPQGTPRPRHAGRHRADYNPPHATRHEWHASPKEVRRASPGCLPRRSLPADQGDRAGLWPPEGSRACPPRMVVPTTGTAKGEGKGLRGPVETALRSTTGRKLSRPVNLHGFP